VWCGEGGSSCALARRVVDVCSAPHGTDRTAAYANSGPLFIDLWRSDVRPSRRPSSLSPGRSFRRPLPPLCRAGRRLIARQPGTRRRCPTRFPLDFRDRNAIACLRTFIGARAGWYGEQVGSRIQILVAQGSGAVGEEMRRGETPADMRSTATVHGQPDVHAPRMSGSNRPPYGLCTPLRPGGSLTSAANFSGLGRSAADSGATLELLPPRT
jgi:hypothetical protein